MCTPVMAGGGGGGERKEEEGWSGTPVLAGIRGERGGGK